MAKYTIKQVKNAIDRIKEYFSFRSDRELSEFLGISKSAVDSWKRRGNINLQVIKLRFPGINVVWLMEGVGEPIIDSKKFNDYYEGDNKGYLLNQSLKMMLSDTKDSYSKNKRDKVPIYNSSLPDGTVQGTYDQVKGFAYLDTIINANCMVIEMTDNSGRVYGFKAGDKVVVNKVLEARDGNIILVSDKDEFHICRYVQGSVNKLIFLDGSEQEFLGHLEFEGVCINIIRSLL